MNRVTRVVALTCAFRFAYAITFFVLMENTFALLENVIAFRAFGNTFRFGLYAMLRERV